METKTGKNPARGSEASENAKAKAREEAAVIHNVSPDWQL